MTRRLLVTGGAGFIGSHLVRRLLDAGDKVVVLDDFSASADPALEDHPELSVVVGDVRRAADVNRAVAEVLSSPPSEPQSGSPRESRDDVIVHLASVVGVEAVLADPRRTGSVIRSGTEQALVAARRLGARVLFFSTSEVTDAARCGPRSVYAEAKRDAERLLMEQAAGEQGVPVTIVRPFNIVGPGQRAPGMVLPAMARAARAGARMPIHGTGRQERSFLHVEDCVDATFRLLDAPMNGRAEVVEIGSEERTSISCLAEQLSKMAGQGASLSCAAMDEGREDLPRRAPNLGPLRQRVPFEPRWKLSEILRQALVHA
ncbi:MAG: NAD-dependent epimerase/dehydratase family protein [Planctomycetota bacterium]|nr:NAD-dependent epimerase/dehydratase family protein [Planctomycetota bacterium]